MSSSSQIVDSWISNFCNEVGHEYFAEVSEDFIEDDFNLTGLASQVPLYKEALEMILDVDPEDDDEEDEQEEDDDDDDEMGQGSPMQRGLSDSRHLRMSNDTSIIETSAELLYGLIHQRYITSRPGIQQMLEKYELNHFGLCPRVLCHNAKVIPVGRFDTPGQNSVKLFCPSCLDIYTPPNSRFAHIDGAFFGTTFGCLFFMTFPDLDLTLQSRTSKSAIASPVTYANPASDAISLSGSTTAVGSAYTASSISPPQPTVINGVTTSNFAPGLGSAARSKIYEPRIYGFRVSDRARSGPRMQWLRRKPSDINQLDEAQQYQSCARELDMNEDEPDLSLAAEQDKEMPDAGDPSGRKKMRAVGTRMHAVGTRPKSSKVLVKGPMDTNGVDATEVAVDAIG